MKLSNILKNITKTDVDCEVRGLSYDSRNIKKDFLFVAIRGLKFDGHSFLKQAQENGACCALVEKKDPNVELPQVHVNDTREALALAANNYYEKPTKSFDLIGVTGTNGKTTVTYMLESILRAAGKKTGLLGTVRYSIGDKDLKVTHTTPESLELQKLFSEMKDAVVDTAIMEVSSHAAKFKRIDGSEFNQIIFTNLTQDHMDFHKDFENYFDAKKRLFELNDDAIRIINADDKYGSRLIDTNDKSKVVTYGLNEADVVATGIKVTGSKISFYVDLDGKTYGFELMIGGYFNIYNALAAIACAHNASISIEDIQKGLKELKVVPGRFETLGLDAPFKVIVDYAHTPDGLENLLNAAKQITNGRVIVVFGCGGDRDTDKRPIMGKLASDLADVIIVTSDNPRTEDPNTIIDQITVDGRSYVREADRAEAIAAALGMAKEKDTVVIAGKGHETTQEINGKTLPFNDSDIAGSIWQAMGG